MLRPVFDAKSINLCVVSISFFAVTAVIGLFIMLWPILHATPYRIELAQSAITVSMFAGACGLVGLVLTCVVFAAEWFQQALFGKENAMIVVAWPLYVISELCILTVLCADVCFFIFCF